MIIMIIIIIITIIIVDSECEERSNEGELVVGLEREKFRENLREVDWTPRRGAH